jgi:hypothetical protein
VIFPLNYVFDQGGVVFRTDLGTHDAAADAAPVAFELDAVDEATRTGWSVVVRGALVESGTRRIWSGCAPCRSIPGPQARRPAFCACSRPR